AAGRLPRVGDQRRAGRVAREPGGDEGRDGTGRARPGQRRGGTGQRRRPVARGTVGDGTGRHAARLRSGRGGGGGTEAPRPRPPAQQVPARAYPAVRSARRRVLRGPATAAGCPVRGSASATILPNPPATGSAA